MNIRDIYGRGYMSDRIGLELELESSRTQSLAWVDKQSMWTVHNDGSLRQNGVEYVFANPLWGGDIDAALQLFEDSTKGTAFVDTGYGSTHVHYNVGNLCTTEVMSIVVGWAILEDAFLTVCKPSRDGNNFAQRFNVLNNLVTTLSSSYIHANKRIDRLFTNISQDYWKYANLNLATIRTFGTLEFRPYHSTWDTKEIRAWIDRIINFCKGMVAIGTPVQVLELADRDLDSFITKYAGVPATEQLIDLTRRNISTAFRLAYVVDEWEDVKAFRENPPKKSNKKKSTDGLVVDELGIDFADVAVQFTAADPVFGENTFDNSHPNATVGDRFVESLSRSAVERERQRLLAAARDQAREQARERERQAARPGNVPAPDFPPPPAPHPWGVTATTATAGASAPVRTRRGGQ